MRSLDVPAEFQRSEHQFPPHAKPPNLEHFCHRFLAEANPRTECVYLPVYWTDNYLWQSRVKRQRGLRGVPELQAWLDETLDPHVRYVTVVQCADGVYERLPPNVHIFSAGGRGDTPIPLLTTPHPRQPRDRNLLASFAGQIECGGQEPGVSDRSGSNPDGPGAKIRRRMAVVFSRQPDCLIWPPGDSAQFRSLMERSTFALCPRGYGPTSFRLYEAIGLGAIPVYIADDPWLPYRDVLDWSAFSVLCGSDEIGSLPERLRALDPGWVREVQQWLPRLLPEYFTMDGLGRQLVRMIEGLQ